MYIYIYIYIIMKLCHSTVKMVVLMLLLRVREPEACNMHRLLRVDPTYSRYP